MNRSIVILVALFQASLSIVLAQNQILILDSNTLEPLPYAHAIFYKNSKVIGGYYTNEHGVFYWSEVATFDTLVFQSIGYHTRRIPFESVTDTINLSRKVVSIPPVTVYGNPSKVHYLGIYQWKRVDFSSAYEGYQRVVKISNPYNKPKKVKSFHFKIKKRATKKSAKLKIIFFKNQSDKPAQEPFASLLVALDSLKGRKIEINLTNQNIYLPQEGFFAGIEWVGCTFEKEWQDWERTSTSTISKCQLAIIVNDLSTAVPNESYYSRDVFGELGWKSAKWFNQAGIYKLPVFGVTVYE